MDTPVTMILDGVILGTITELPSVSSPIESTPVCFVLQASTQRMGCHSGHILRID